MTRSPTEIKSILEEVMESSKFRNRWAEHLIQSKWESWVGNKIAQHIRPNGLKDEQLTVIIDDERWASSFDGFKDKILENMRKDLDSISIKEFNVMVDKKRPGPKTPKKRIKEKAKNEKASSKVQTSSPAQSLDKETEKDLNSIKDPGVREALKRLIIKDMTSKNN
ncbi:MAG: DciA family protein [bacterium]